MSRQWPQTRCGAVLVLAAALMVVVFAFAAFSVDIGYVSLTKQELQNVADASALAAAQLLCVGTAEADAAAEEVAQQNLVASQPAVVVAAEDVEYGVWDEADGFQPIAAGEDPTVVRVTARLSSMRGNQLNLFFAPLLGHSSAELVATAVATAQPRDIVLVLDFSGSMNDDSELKAFSTLGQVEVEANLYEMYLDLGSPQYGNMQFDPVYLDSSDVGTVVSSLGLDGVAYPCPSGSWAEYVQYVMNDGDVNAAGYRKSYGYLTLIQYWLNQQASHAQTPDLWRTSAQPVSALKEGVSEFLDYLDESAPQDRVGLVVYTYSDAVGAMLESPLTDDHPAVESIAWQRQAGHYVPYTNIGAGMQAARMELVNNSRPEAHRLMVLMTDGIANRPGTLADARQFVLDEASAAAAADVRIMTISVGANADTALMQQVADLADGVHFNVPGGQPVTEYTQQLRDVFREVAQTRHTKLIQ